jgi:murein DD-endopeptidase MepM/ murein hydrolase activator NlpD
LGIRPSWLERLGRRAPGTAQAEVLSRGREAPPAGEEPPVIDVTPGPEATPDFEAEWWRMPPVGERSEPAPFPAELLRARSPRWVRRLRVAAADTVRQPLARQVIGAVLLAVAAIAASSIPGTIGRRVSTAVLWTLHQDYDPVALARTAVSDVPGLKQWLKSEGIVLPAAAAAAPTHPAVTPPTSSASPYATPMGALTPPLEAPVAVGFGAPVLVSGGGGKTAPSQGLLFWATASTPVHAIAAGQVLAATASATLGNYVLLNHLDGWSSLYAHCESLLVHPGDRVAKGQAVCTTGRVGSQFGPYLYFELRRDGAPVDPGPYLGIKEPVSR